jgi:sulfite reductase (ferredoxin)
MQSTYNLPDTLREDLERFQEEVARFKQGALGGAEFRAFRVPQGVYEERTEGSYMLRVRLPAGGLLPAQMRALASVARAYGSGVLHLTTRQDAQVHGVSLDNIHPALAALGEAGLSTKGGGGNTVRNIIACPDAGVCAREEFDVAPYAVALTEFLLPDPLSYRMPRKYKIAFSGCPADCGGAMVNDLAFFARTRQGRRGFSAYVAGGMGANCRVAEPLEDFVPAEEVHYVAEAVKRVFDRHGNRRNKHRARLRYLMADVGPEAFRRLYGEELAALRADGLPPLQVRDLPGRRPEPPPVAEEPAEGFAGWRARNVIAQKDDGYYMVHVPLVLGDIDARAMAGLADVVEAHGEGAARTTQRQNVLLRWVHDDELPGLHRALLAVGLAGSAAPIVRNTVSCAGAATCKLGVCLSRGLSRAVVKKLEESGIDLDALGEMNVQISGCPNCCGRHPLGRIGLYGAARRIGGRLVPHYVVQLGARLGEGRTRLAEGNHTIPARNVPDLVADLLRSFLTSASYPDYDAFVDAEAGAVMDALYERYRHVPSFEDDKNFYYDWGADTPFSLAGRGPGECSSGVFDLIQVDLASAEQALAEGDLFSAVVLAARALLVTRGHEAHGEAESLDLFQTDFVAAGLVDASFGELVGRAWRSIGGAFDAQPAEAAALVEAVKTLYGSLDSSLRFQAPPAAPAAAPSSSEDGDHRADFRGVACPLNYVMAKRSLESMASGEVLSITLGKEGARNVPESAAKDGHKVVSVTEEGDHWRVVIRKG